MIKESLPRSWLPSVLVIMALLLGAGVNLITVGRVCLMVTLQFLTGAVTLRRLGADGLHGLGVGPPLLTGMTMSVAVRQFALATDVWDPTLVVLGVLAMFCLCGERDWVRRSTQTPGPTILLAATSAALTHDMHWPIAMLVPVAAFIFLVRHSRWGIPRGLGAAGVACGVLVSRSLTAHDQWLAHRTDYLFFDGLARSIDRFGIWDNPFATGTRLSYHTLTYAWLGQLERTAGVDRWTAIATIGPVVLGVVAFSQLWALCVRLNICRPAIVLIISAGMSSIAGWSVGLHLLRLESLSSLLGGIGVLAIATLVSPSMPAGGRTVAIAFALTAMTTAAKITHGLVAAAYLVAVQLSAEGLTRRQRLIRCTTAPVAAALGILLFMPPWAQTADATMGVRPLALTWQIQPETIGAPLPSYLLASALIVITICAPALVAVALRTRTSLASSRGLRVSISSGMVAFLVLGTCCMGQGYFLQAVLLLSCAPLVGAVSDTMSRRTVVWCAIGATLQILLFAGPVLMPELLRGFRGAMMPYLVAVPVTAGLGRWLISPLRRVETARVLAALTVGIGLGAAGWNLASSTDARTILTRDEVSPLDVLPKTERNLAMWFRATTTRDDVIASQYGLCDRDNCATLSTGMTSPLACHGSWSEGVRNCWFGSGTPLVSILDRRFFVTHFSWLSRGATPEPIARRIAETVRFAVAPHANSLAPLREAAVKWFIVDKDLPHADDYGAVGTVRYENARFIVLELHDA